MFKTVAFVFILAGAAASKDFVLVQGGLLRPGTPSLRVGAFEMADHPVTNAEYETFVRETGHAAPLHWKDGRIPAGLADHPVIFVNRYDAADYIAWRTRKERRIYRLPTASEFELAARGGQAGAVYPWGKDNPAGKANYDAAGERTFAQWRQLLKPVKSYAPNPFGLYDMAEPAVKRAICCRPTAGRSGASTGVW